MISCSSVPLAPQDARDIYLPICLTAAEKAALKKTQALGRDNLERIIRNNLNFNSVCPK